MFATPLFLIAAAVGALVPLVLHVIQSKRRIVMPFSTLRFLKMADKKSSQRARMEHFLLWFLRTMIMVLLGLAFAMPTLRLSDFSWLGNAPRDVALVIDASYSMGYRKTKQSVWDEAKATATALMDSLGENDRFCIFVAGEQPIPIVGEPSTDLDGGKAQIKALKLNQGVSQLAPALQRALDALNEDARGRQKEVYVITDNQALPWRSFGTREAGEGDEQGGEDAAATGWDPSKLDALTTLYVVQLGVDEPQNSGIVDVDLSPRVLFRTSKAFVAAEVAQTGLPSPTTVTLFVDGQEVGRRAAMGGSNEGARPQFALPPLEPGIHVGRLETPEDSLDADNAFHFLLQVKKEIPTLCVGSEEDSLFVRAALKAGASVGLESKWISTDKLEAEPLHPYAAVFLCNVLPLPGGAVSALEAYARAGGLVAFFPGNRATVQDYQALPWLPAQPKGIRNFARTDRKQSLGWSEPLHPLVRPLRSGLASPAVSLRQCLVWEEIPDATTRLISLGAEEAFLLDRSMDRGKVLFCAVSADRTWGEFPLSPFFLPVIHQMVTYGAGVGGFPSYVWSQPSLPLSTILPGVTREASLVGPDQRPASIRSTVVEGRTVLHAEGVSAPGVYTLSSEEYPQGIAALAVNRSREESDLSPVSTDQIEQLLGVKTLYLAQDQASLLKLVQDHRIGRSYGEHLLWLAFILIVLEFAYANRLAKGGRSLISLLGIEASGNVKGGV